MVVHGRTSHEFAPTFSSLSYLDCLLDKRKVAEQQLFYGMLLPEFVQNNTQEEAGDIPKKTFGDSDYADDQVPLVDTPALVEICCIA